MHIVGSSRSATGPSLIQPHRTLMLRFPSSRDKARSVGGYMLVTVPSVRRTFQNLPTSVLPRRAHVLLLSAAHQFHARLEEESRLRQEETRLRLEAQANALLQQEQAMKMQQALFQQQEFMVKQQAALQETFARFSTNMQGSTLPDLPPVPPLPTFSFVSLQLFNHASHHLTVSCLKCPRSGEGSNNFVVGGSAPAQASPVTPTGAHGASTSTPQ
ncbi:hypothetical protein VPH35_011147 [Triticum aestivum]